jgi:hypothetical protein
VAWVILAMAAVKRVQRLTEQAVAQLRGHTLPGCIAGSRESLNVAGWAGSTARFDNKEGFAAVHSVS